MELKDLITILQSYGIGGLLIVVGVFFLYLLLKSSWFSNFSSKIGDAIIDKFVAFRTSNSKLKSVNESEILNHDIFNYINFMMYSKVPTIKFSSEYRTVVFRKYLTIYLQAHKVKIREYIEKKDFEKMDESELWNSLLSLINSIIFEYETGLRTAKIPEIIIERMKTKNNDTLSLTIDLLEGVCNSNFYESDKNLLKMYSILNIILSILENTISAADLICNSINGELKGLKYSENGKEYKES